MLELLLNGAQRDEGRLFLNQMLNNYNGALEFCMRHLLIQILSLSPTFSLAVLLYVAIDGTNGRFCSLSQVGSRSLPLDVLLNDVHPLLKRKCLSFLLALEYRVVGANER